MRIRLLTAVAVLLAIGPAAGCGQDHTATGAPSPVAAKPGAAQPVAAEPVAAATGWPTRPVTVTHTPAVPPVPVVTGVRYAGHPEGGYDRFVVDLRGGMPGYAVRYVDAVTGDASGRPIAVPGRRYLLLTLTPAQAHTDAGATTVAGTHRIGLPMLAGYAVAGDDEGHVSIALGLNAAAGFRVGELSDRIYVDVATE
jgi:hypothetical protein